MKTSTRLLSPDDESMLTQPTLFLKQYISEEVLDGMRPSGGAEATINITATIKKPDRPDQVLKLPEWGLSDLYERSAAPRIEFVNAIDELNALTKELAKHQEGSVDWELHSSKMYVRMRTFGRFLGISERHDEVIFLFQTVAVSEGPRPLTETKREAHGATFSRLYPQLVLTSTIVDGIVDLLERAEFDVNFPMSFLKNA